MSDHKPILPPGFVYLAEIDATILQDIRYYGANNFVGRPIAGYKAPRAILTAEAANALSVVQQRLQAQSLALKVFDAYRPQRAVNDFIAWSEQPEDACMKAVHYPHMDKRDLFTQHYLAKKSKHSRGSTVDLTIVSQMSAKDRDAEFPELDMGTVFDFMDEKSHSLTTAISAEAQRNRLLLRELMMAAGFMPIRTEWWHFTLAKEPFPDTYFDFEVI